MASFFNSIKESIAQAVSNFIPQASTPSGPLSFVPGDIIPLIFSFLDERNKALLGRVCKSFNESYLYVSPVGQVCKQLNQQMRTLAEELIEAVVARPLTYREAQSFGLIELDPRFSIKKKFIAEEKLFAFWQMFQNTLQDAQIFPIFENYAIFALFARTIMKSAFTGLTAGQHHHQLMKLETTINKFNEKVFNGFCESYAKQPLDKITIDSFKQQVASIKNYFPKSDVMQIETELRKAIETNHGNTALHQIID